MSKTKRNDGAGTTGNAADSVVANENANAAERPIRATKYGRLRAAIRERGSITIADAIVASGFDANNVRVAFAILRNPVRSRGANYVATTYDRATKTYTIVRDADGIESVDSTEPADAIVR